jgi:hypothetical protein
MALREVLPFGILECGLTVVVSEHVVFSEQETTQMTPWQDRATGLIRRMADDMKLRNLAFKTIDS